MKLTLQRFPTRHTCTIGELLMNGEPFCHTLEDLVRADPNPSTPFNEAKVPGETAIPPGLYEVRLTVSERARCGGLWTPSPKFLLPEIIGVPGYVGVRFHAGNTHENTAGCPLVGRWTGGESLQPGSSRSTLELLMEMIDIDRIMARPISVEVLAAT